MNGRAGNGGLGLKVDHRVGYVLERVKRCCLEKGVEKHS